jgi:hypothetical protein
MERVSDGPDEPTYLPCARCGDLIRVNLHATTAMCWACTDELRNDDPYPEERTMIYEPSDDQRKDLDNRFTYHQPKETQGDRYVFLREHARALAEDIVCCAPPSREQALALTNLEQAIFWANAAIARHE